MVGPRPHPPSLGPESDSGAGASSVCQAHLQGTRLHVGRLLPQKTLQNLLRKRQGEGRIGPSARARTALALAGGRQGAGAGGGGSGHPMCAASGRCAGRGGTWCPARQMAQRAPRAQGRGDVHSARDLPPARAPSNPHGCLWNWTQPDRWPGPTSLSFWELDAGTMPMPRSAGPAPRGLPPQDTPPGNDESPETTRGNHGSAQREALGAFPGDFCCWTPGLPPVDAESFS